MFGRWCFCAIATQTPSAHSHCRVPCKEMEPITVTNAGADASARSQNEHQFAIMRTAATDDPAARLMYLKACLLVMAPPSARTHLIKHAINSTTTHTTNCRQRHARMCETAVNKEFGQPHWLCRVGDNMQMCPKSAVCIVCVFYTVPALAILVPSISLHG